jgi:hypothetical protein
MTVTDENEVQIRKLEFHPRHIVIRYHVGAETILAVPYPASFRIEVTDGDEALVELLLPNEAVLAFTTNRPDYILQLLLAQSTGDRYGTIVPLQCWLSC